MLSYIAQVHPDQLGAHHWAVPRGFAGAIQMFELYGALFVPSALSNLACQLLTDQIQCWRGQVEQQQRVGLSGHADLCSGQQMTQGESCNDGSGPICLTKPEPKAGPRTCLEAEACG